MNQRLFPETTSFVFDSADRALWERLGLWGVSRLPDWQTRPEFAFFDSVILPEGANVPRLAIPVLQFVRPRRWQKASAHSLLLIDAADLKEPLILQSAMQGFQGTFVLTADSKTGQQDLETFFSQIPSDRKRIISKFVSELKSLEGFFIPSEGFAPLDCEELGRGSEFGQTRATVVIPHFENWERLEKVLQSWSTQTEPVSVVVVDDGSDRLQFKSFVEKWKTEKRFLWLHLPRRKMRKRGDHQFRAGRARNWGSLFAKTELLIFADSDIFVPQTYCEVMEFHHKEGWDLVMPNRWQLMEEPSRRPHLQALQINIDLECYLSAGAHWESFQVEPIEWSRRETPWKWSSSFCFSIRRQIFEELRGFHPAFDSYGFEDTEFGYRLWKTTQKWKIISLPCFHLFQTDELSEFGNRLQKRNQLVRRSANRFFEMWPEKNVEKVLRPWLEVK